MPKTNVTTGTVRLSYLHVFKPYAATDGQEPKYSVCLLIPKTDTVTIKAIKEACEEARVNSAEKFGGKVPSSLKSPLRDGDEERPDDPSYAGMYFLNAKSGRKPTIVDRNAQAIIDETQLYSGCYGRAALNFYVYNVSGNRGIAAGLNGVQKVRDGEALGGGGSVSFSVVEDEDDLGF